MRRVFRPFLPFGLSAVLVLGSVPAVAAGGPSAAAAAPAPDAVRGDADPFVAPDAARQEARLRPVVRPTAIPPQNERLERRVIPEAEVMTLFRTAADANVARLRPYDAAADLSLAPVDPGASVTAAGHLDVLAADFDRDGIDEAVSVSGRCDAQRHVCFQLYRGGIYTRIMTSRTTPDPDFTAGSARGEGRVKIAAGNVDADPAPELILAYEADRAPNAPVLVLVAYDYANGRFVQKGDRDTGGSVRRGTDFALALGNLDGGTATGREIAGELNDDEIAVAWTAASATSATVRVFDWRATSTPRIQPVTPALAVETTAGIPGNVSLAVGKMRKSPRESIALGWSSADKTGFSVLAVTGKGATLALAQRDARVLYDFNSGNDRAVRVAVGDVTGDGFDDIVVAYLDELDGIDDVATATHIKVYQVSSALLVTELAAFSKPGFREFMSAGDDGSGHLDLAIGKVHPSLLDPHNLRPQIVIAYTALPDGDSDHQEVATQVFGLRRTSTAWTVDHLGGRRVVSPYHAGRDPEFASIALGDFDGNSIRLGTPRAYTVSNLVRPIVIVKAVPTHYDRFGTKNYNPNNCYEEQFNNYPYPDGDGGACYFYALYSKNTTQKIDVKVTQNEDWGVSTAVSGEANWFVTVKASLKVSYGEKFSKVEGTTETVNVGVDVIASPDDQLYGSVMTYDVLEYPVYKDTSHRAVAYVAVVSPEVLTNTWFPSKDTYGNGYLPIHEVGNLLSYPTAVPADADRVFSSDAFKIGPSTGFTRNLDFERLSTAGVSRAKSTSIEPSLSVGGEYGIFSGEISVEGNYTFGEIQDRTTEYGEATKIKMVMGGIAAQEAGPGEPGGRRNYEIQPFVRYDENGAFVLDYAVKLDLPVPGETRSWWQTRYGVPDPALILPQRLDPEKEMRNPTGPYERTRTKSIRFSNPTPLVGDVVRMTATIRNFSIVPVNTAFKVRFYNGDPAAGGALIGTPRTVAAGVLKARGTTSVATDWTVPASAEGRALRIFVVVDQPYPGKPGGDVAPEIHDANNKGWAVLAVKSGAARPRIASLSSVNRAAGSPGFTLTVNGAYFTSRSIVRWNGFPRSTQVVNASTLRATIPASDLAAPRTVLVDVFTAAPGGGTSAPRAFTVDSRVLNGGFEQVGTGGTVLAWGADPQARRSASIRYSGLHSLVIRPSALNRSFTVRQDVAGLASGQWALSGRVNVPASSVADADGFTFRMRVVWRNSTGATIGGANVGGAFRATTSGWVQRAATLTAPAGTARAFVELVSSSLSRPVHVDDVVMRRP